MLRANAYYKPSRAWAVTKLEGVGRSASASGRRVNIGSGWLEAWGCSAQARPRATALQSSLHFAALLSFSVDPMQAQATAKET